MGGAYQDNSDDNYRVRPNPSGGKMEPQKPIVKIPEPKKPADAKGGNIAPIIAALTGKKPLQPSAPAPAPAKKPPEAPSK